MRDDAVGEGHALLDMGVSCGEDDEDGGEGKHEHEGGDEGLAILNEKILGTFPHRDHFVRADVQLLLCAVVVVLANPARDGLQPNKGAWAVCVRVCVSV